MWKWVRRGIATLYVAVTSLILVLVMADLEDKKNKLKRVDAQLTELDLRTSLYYSDLDCNSQKWGVAMLRESFLGIQVRCLGRDLRSRPMVARFEALNPFAIPLPEIDGALYFGADVNDKSPASRTSFKLPDLPAHTLTTFSVEMNAPSEDAVKHMYFIVTTKGGLPFTEISSPR